MARVVRFHQTGGPEVLTIEDLPDRQPAAGEVRIRVRALGLNRAEALFRMGRYLETPKLPSRIGYEAAGTVEAVGDGVSAFAVGDDVSIIPSFSMSEYGVYGEQAVVPATAVARTPDGLDAVAAAALWMQYLTAYGALIDIARIRPGEPVIISAASSSVGIAAIQIARQAGAVPIATTRSGAKTDALRALGAAHVIASERQNIVSEVNSVTAGRGARVIFDAVAGPWVEQLAETAAAGGMIILYGILSMRPTPFPLFTALQKGLSVRGYTLFEIVKDPARLEAGKAYVTDGIASGALKPVVARTFPLDQIVEAHRYLEGGEQIGKIVVTV